jgi:hypothetical protein
MSYDVLELKDWAENRADSASSFYGWFFAFVFALHF